jgi:hypothetical protein
LFSISGKVNSLFGVAEALVPLVYAPLYTQVYRATIDYNSGLFFLLGGFLTVPSCVIFLWMYLVSRNEERLKQSQDMETNIVEVTPSGDDGKAHSNEGINRTSGSSTKTNLAFINTAFVKDEAESKIAEDSEESPTLHLEYTKQ